ncbi:efflux RND transporter periplasmic adaptor subunit [Roseiterribacter gracilis]|uniref:Hemolysin D n=1 Tax=Roseiterribacter gracilis TaxID=2812848 RepID=A0A8S8XK21_9PROT|nr:hemolysin D [Rhodospirillales bacterium TMPK1]
MNQTPLRHSVAADPAPKSSPLKSRLSPRNLAIAGVVVLAVLGYAIVTRIDRANEASRIAAAARNATRTVRVAQVSEPTGPVSMQLPGETRALETATILARATGYVRTRKADIGMRVATGDVLAEIDAPELDDELRGAEAAKLQADAALNRAKAAAELARLNNERYADLAKTGTASRQTADERKADLVMKQADVKVAEANLAASNAAVERLKKLQNFETVRAPFDGVVTQRGVEIGDLVSATGANPRPLFTVARDDLLRIQVSVPQSFADGVKPGTEAGITLPERPGAKYTGKVVRSSDALTTASRTLQVELELANAERAVRAGSYVQVNFTIPPSANIKLVPASALMLDPDGQGPRVAIVKDGVVSVRKVMLGRDLGQQLEVLDGIAKGETVVLNPPVDLIDGAKVNVAT